MFRGMTIGDKLAAGRSNAFLQDLWSQHTHPVTPLYEFTHQRELRLDITAAIPQNIQKPLGEVSVIRNHCVSLELLDAGFFEEWSNHCGEC